MTLQQLKKEIEEIKNSIISETEQPVKIFIFNIGGLTTTEGLTAAEVEEYTETHKHTKVVNFYLKDMGCINDVTKN